MTILNLAAAEEIIEAAHQRAQLIGKAVSIAVVDAGGFRSPSAAPTEPARSPRTSPAPRRTPRRSCSAPGRC
ncbi:heme-binding protein [Streptomyces diastatochromogenes]|nr:heme-binding protein [Streptomyces diastatochromogenes]